MENISLRALVIREIDFGDHDRYVHVLAEDGRRLEILCRGIRRKGARQAAAMRLFCYSELELYQGRGGKLSLQSADLVTSFWGITASMEQFALACYFAELAGTLTNAVDENPAITRLFLYALRALAVQNRDRLVVKAAFELRLVAESGFLPNFTVCDACGCMEETHVLWFSVAQGTVRCQDCVSRLGANGYVCLHPSTLAAVVHILHAEMPRVFAFAVGEQAGSQLARLCEDYTRYHLDRTLESLGFYHQMNTL